MHSWHSSSAQIIFDGMCGRIIQSSEPLRLAIVEGLNVSDSRLGKIRPRYNGAPSQELLVIRENHKTASARPAKNRPGCEWLWAQAHKRIPRWPIPPHP